MAANNREARRQRILERGSDRLALITGRIDSLPPSIDSSPLPLSQHSDPAPSQPLIPNDEASRLHVFDQSTTVSPHGEAEEWDSALQNHDPVSDTHLSKAYNGNSSTHPLRESEDNNEISRVPTPEVEQVLLPPDSSLDTSGTNQHSQPQTRETRFFNPSEISDAITISESTRRCCSVVIALLVVLSYLGFPLLGSWIMKSIISFRPLYLVLVTNITLVAVQLIAGKQRGLQRAAGRQNTTSRDEDGWAEHLGRTLEAALVIRNVMDAFFMDCSIYAIIVICGLSLVQIFSK
ncbi:hypothetical protein L6164_024175 [Bauhinia variegata]|uniref:Uncharacterized protein n=1 Tax=Bauhinia variegata TaxID=167791 RepID=A0ACB9LWH0_BAUVA|nr:hypothetical protein L6164_024175 [Bauhinia variegata]